MVYVIDLITRQEFPTLVRIHREEDFISLYEKASPSSLFRLARAVNRRSGADRGRLHAHADGWTYTSLE